MLTTSQSERLKACTRALDAPARVVVVGAGTVEAADALRAGARDGVEVLGVAPDGLDKVDGPVDVLFVARAGRYSAAAETLERWGGRVVPSGTMFVHGAFASPPVTAALLRTIGSSREWRYFGRDGALAEYTRADLTPGERALDAIAQLAQLPAFVRSLARRRGEIGVRARRETTWRFEVSAPWMPGAARIRRQCQRALARIRVAIRRRGAGAETVMLFFYGP